MIPHIRLFLYCLRLRFAIPNVSVGETKPEPQSAEKLSGKQSSRKYYVKDKTATCLLASLSYIAKAAVLGIKLSKFLNCRKLKYRKWACLSEISNILCNI